MNGLKVIAGCVVLMMLFGACSPAPSAPAGSTQAAPAAPAAATQKGVAATQAQAGPSALLAKFTGPQAGAPMAWFDGSVLVFIPDLNGAENGGQKGFWITLDPISNYQFSLCVQAGLCQPPVGTQVAKDYKDVLKQHLMVGWVGPDQPKSYCTWIKGRLPALSETALLGQIPNPFFTGGMNPADYFATGIHCIVEHPAPLPMFLRASPYYNPDQPIAFMKAVVTGSRQSCEGQVSTMAFDLKFEDLDNDAVFNSVTSSAGANCQHVLGSDRIVCSGSTGPDARVNVGLLCDGYTGIKCQTGSSADASGCSIPLIKGQLAGMDDWEINANGIFVPLKPIQLPNGAVAAPLLRNQVIIGGVMVAHGLTVNSMTENGIGANGLATNGPAANGMAGNGLDSNGVAVNGLSTNGAAGSGTPQGASGGEIPARYYEAIHKMGSWARDPLYASEAGQSWHPIPVICPVGYYFDAPAQSCIRLSEPETSCPAGFSWNKERSGCEAAQPNGNYPGCPLGQVFDPTQGICDPLSKIMGNTTLLQITQLKLDLPICAEPTKVIKHNNDGDGGGGAGGEGGSFCPAGQTYVCTGINALVCACK